MSDFDPELFEKELLKLQPAKPPQPFLRRILAGTEVMEQPRISPGIQRFKPWWLRLGWAAATAAVVVIVSLFFFGPLRPQKHEQAHSALASTELPMKADDVEVDQQLVAAFDAVAQLPDGAPVRLRCREWRDAVVLRDSARGVVIERQAPRLEVIPIRFETY